MSNATKNRKLKFLTLTIGGNPYTVQVKSWKITNNTDDGERFFVYVPSGTPITDGEFREQAEDDYALTVSFFSDWTVNGFSDFLVQNDQQTVAFQLDHHQDIPGEYVRWAGSLKVKAPEVGGDVRTTEQQEVTMQCVGKPTYTRP